MQIDYKAERIVETRNGETTKDEVRVERKKTISWGGDIGNSTSYDTLSFPTDELSTLIKKLQAVDLSDSK